MLRQMSAVHCANPVYRVHFCAGDLQVPYEAARSRFVRCWALLFADVMWLSSFG